MLKVLSAFAIFFPALGLQGVQQGRMSRVGILPGGGFEADATSLQEEFEQRLNTSHVATAMDEAWEKVFRGKARSIRMQRSSWFGISGNPLLRTVGECCGDDIPDFLRQNHKDIPDAVIAFGGSSEGHVMDKVRAGSSAKDDVYGPCCIMEWKQDGPSKWWWDFWTFKWEWHEETEDEIKAGLKTAINTPYSVFSASKWIAGYLTFRMIDAKLVDSRGHHFTLDTPMHDIFTKKDGDHDFVWTSDPDDLRSKVTVRHLLAQTDGMQTFGGQWEGLGACTEWSTAACAKLAYKHTFKWAKENNVKPGETFRYAQTSFMVLGAALIKIAQKNGKAFTTYDEVFQEYMAGPLGLKDSHWTWPWVNWLFVPRHRSQDPGASMQTTLKDYTKFLTSAYFKQLASEDLMKEGESPQTIGSTCPGSKVLEIAHKVSTGMSEAEAKKEADEEGDEKMPTKYPFISVPVPEDVRFHYGLGCWIEMMNVPDALTTDKNADLSQFVWRVSSLGALGTYPWVERRAGKPATWGLILREDMPDFDNLPEESMGKDVHKIAQFARAAFASWEWKKSATR